MTSYEIPYGGGFQRVELEGSSVIAVVRSKPVAKPDSMKVLHRALQEPVDAPHIADFLKPGSKVLVIVNDGSRPTPTRKVLESVWGHLKKCDARFIVATGTHGAPTDEEMLRIFGPLLPEVEGRLSIHDAKSSEFVRIGQSSKGNEFLVNKQFDLAEGIFVIGSIEPHYFAGFTGGRKAFLPGISAYATVERNHRNAMSPDSQVLRLDGNPVHDEMAELEAMLKQRKPDGIYTVQTISMEGEVPFAACGDVTKAFRALVPKAVELFCSPIPARADVVVTAAVTPGDASLYQAQKALEHARPAMKKGATSILVSECPQGIGSRNFYDLLSASPDPREVIAEVAASYKLGWHKAAKLAGMSIDGRVMMVSSIPEDVLKKAFVMGHASLEGAMAAALKDFEDPKIILMPEGNITVPVPPDVGRCN